MTFLPISIASSGRPVLPLDLILHPAANDVKRVVERSLREDNWENEGGHLAGARTALQSSTVSAKDIERLGVQVRLMECTLASDFANGRVGIRHNIYAHRSRVLRQQKAKLEDLRYHFQLEA